MSFVVVGAGFLWVTVSHYSSRYSCLFSVDGSPPACVAAACVGCLPLFRAFIAAALASAGFVKSTYLSKISSSVSGSSSIVASGVFLVVLAVFPICAVGLVCGPYYVAAFTCS